MIGPNSLIAGIRDPLPRNVAQISSDLQRSQKEAAQGFAEMRQAQQAPGRSIF